jgi:hypothetical protein
MIALHSECLLFELANGESVPCSVTMISVEVVGEAGGQLDAELLQHAAASVFHYFKAELNRETVTVGEFSLALEKVLHHLGYPIHAGGPGHPLHGIRETDLRRLALDAAGNLELFFFPRLRDELRTSLRQSPRVLHFHGLRGCAKQLAGARRWSPRCQEVQDQIVEFLRGCLTAETKPSDCALMVK